MSKGPIWRHWERHKIIPRGVDTPPGERHRFLDALTVIEERLGHRHGWDRPARLMAVRLIADGTYETRTVPRREWAPRLAAHDVDQLAAYAARFPPLPTGAVRRVQHADTADGLCAVALLAEGYGVDWALLTDDEKRRMAQGERIAMAHPAGIEERLVCAVDVNGVVYHVNRPRGGEPQAWMLESDAGRVPHALARIVVALRPTGNAVS